MSKLLETKKARSLQCNFTGCIIDPPSQFHDSGGCEYVLDFLEKHVSPFFNKLIPGAHILFRVISPDDLIDYILFFGKLNMPLRAALSQSEDANFKWLLFQKLGPGKLPKINPKKTFPYHLPDTSWTDLEHEIFSGTVDRYAATQNILRPLVKMICPKPKQSNILVPFCWPGQVIAACEALKIDSVGFDYSKDADEEDHQYVSDVIAALSDMPTD